MAKEEWGVKRVCPTTGKRFYDLNADPIISPYTGEVVVLDTGKGKSSLVADKPDAQSKESEDALADDEDVILDDDDDGADDDVDLGDDVLEEDDDDTVSLDELADVASENEDDS
ncbi:MAG: TIGR02300 family protein [Litoreibacter sp.]|nr:TIGR02300 family protein [Litoreibacter sp.]